MIYRLIDSFKDDADTLDQWCSIFQNGCPSVELFSTMAYLEFCKFLVPHLLLSKLNLVYPLIYGFQRLGSLGNSLYPFNKLFPQNGLLTTKLPRLCFLRPPLRTRKRPIIYPALGKTLCAPPGLYTYSTHFSFACTLATRLDRRFTNV